jgi:hypothetical protein
MSEQLDNSVLNDGIVFRAVKLFNFCEENRMLYYLNNFVSYVHKDDKACNVRADTKQGLIESIRNSEINDYERLYKYLDKVGF